VAEEVGNPDVDNSTQFYFNQAVPLPPVPITQIFTGDTTTVINTINGNSGQASGPTITISGGSTGYEFVASSGLVSLAVNNAATVRSSISAAESGSNADITDFTGLTGNTGVNPWTGVADGSSQSTYPTTVASAAYVQAEMQGLMDKMQDVTEFMMFLVAALLAPGVVET
jgi:hypothetical protein